MGGEAQRLLEDLAERFFINQASPIRPALDALGQGACLKVFAPGGSAAVRRQGEQVVLVDPDDCGAFLELHFHDPSDLRAFDEVRTAEDFGSVFLSLVREGRMRLDILGSFMELWAMGVGQFLMGIHLLSPPEEYRRLIEPLHLRDIAFTEILDVDYLQGLVDELARITGVRLWVLDMDCLPVVVSSTGGEHCQLIIDSLEGVMRCYESAIGGLMELKKSMAPRVRICHAGFICFDAPLILGEEMVGMISGDASLSDPPDPEKYRRLAEELGIDPEPLLASLKKVRTVRLEEVEFLLSVVNALTRSVTEMSYKQFVNTRLNRELEQKNFELRSLFQAVTEIQEREKAAVARDLHDDTGQHLTNALVNLEMALSEEGLSEETRRHLRSAAESVSQVMEKLHDLSATLHPHMLDDLGLLEALRNLVRRLNADFPMDFSLVVRGEEGELPGEVKINLYRIVQEALTNVVKHSGATRAKVYFGRDGEGVDLLVTDDGRGFSPYQEDGKVHLGLVNMRERASQIGGTFRVITDNGGVTVAVHVPLDN
ncbi:MAG: PocR ligand-binding domain-containing protein [Actinomycetota bacterium]